MSSLKKYLTTQEYAEKAGISASTVSKWLRSGKLKGEKQNGKWVIPVEQSGAETGAAPEVSKTAQSPNAPKKTTDPKPGKLYSIETFSAMTYLTEFGVEKWLKEGRLKGIKDKSGQWQVSAESLELVNVQRLLRN